jgi:hypothetical protein
MSKISAASAAEVRILQLPHSLFSSDIKPLKSMGLSHRLRPDALGREAPEVQQLVMGQFEFPDRDTRSQNSTCPSAQRLDYLLPSMKWLVGQFEFY